MNVLKLSYAILCLALGAAAGCRTAPSGGPLARFEFAQPHMGTLWTLTLYAPDPAAATNAAHAAFARIAALDRMMTDYNPDSELMRLGKSPVGQPQPLSQDLFDVLALCQEFSRASGGAFDVTAGPVVQLWRRARRQRELPDPARLEKARQSVGYERLRLDPRRRTATLLAENLRLDLGGIAKGYAADAALRVLRKMGAPRALVAASGDLAIGDPPPGRPGWRVGVGAPGSFTNLAGTLCLRNAAVSTSGDTEQFVTLGGVRYSHIVDPRTGRALTNRLQVTVVADRAARSDALATTVCVLGPGRGQALIESLGRPSTLIFAPGADGGYLSFSSPRFPPLQKDR